MGRFIKVGSVSHGYFRLFYGDTHENGTIPYTGYGPYPRRYTTAQMSVQMPTTDQFGIPDHLLGLVRFSGLCEAIV
jgi:hypothetical protein